ncbi:MAG: hypothetical protein QME64_07690 [bacterium]|nr:hypothetical protein [bacterium]
MAKRNNNDKKFPTQQSVNSAIKSICDIIGGRKVRIIWDKPLDTPRVEEPFDGFTMRSYRYAWSEFYPKINITK